MAKLKEFMCEGCCAVEHDPLLPDGWFGYGMSASAPKSTAHWCPTCHADGSMERVSATTYRRAVSVAKSRGTLTRLRSVEGSN